jgi:hypothetical protein
VVSRLRTITRQLPFASQAALAEPAPAPSPVLAEAEK